MGITVSVWRGRDREYGQEVAGNRKVKCSAKQVHRGSSIDRSCKLEKAKASYLQLMLTAGILKPAGTAAALVINDQKSKQPVKMAAGRRGKVDRQERSKVPYGWRGVLLPVGLLDTTGGWGGLAGGLGGQLLARSLSHKHNRPFRFRGETLA